jgi:hypothetical protein
MGLITVKIAFAVAGIILGLVILLQPRLRNQPGTDQADLRSRILEALSEAANREIREADYDAPTAKYFTPHEVISAVDFIEGEINLDIPRSVYWQDTVGAVVQSICTFAEQNAPENTENPDAAA